jgi:hypothetical protein
MASRLSNAPSPKFMSWHIWECKAEPKRAPKIEYVGIVARRAVFFANDLIAELPVRSRVILQPGQTQKEALHCTTAASPARRKRSTLKLFYLSIGFYFTGRRSSQPRYSSWSSHSCFLAAVWKDIQVHPTRCMIWSFVK